MLAAAVICLAILSLVALYLGRDFTFPPAIFCLVWFLSLMVLWFAGGLYNAVGLDACLIFVVGALSFCFGGLLALACPVGPIYENSTATAHVDRRYSRIAADGLLALLILAFPYYWTVVTRIAGGAGPLMLQAIRQVTVEASGQENPFGFVAGNLNVVAGLVAMVMVYELDGTAGRRIRAISAVGLALIYSALTGSKQGLALIVALVLILPIKTRRTSLTKLVVFIALGLGVFVAGLATINFGQRTFGTSAELASVLGLTLLDYWLGGMVGFQHVLDSPAMFGDGQFIDRFFLEAGRSLGLGVEVPSQHLPYVPIGFGRTCNTYTIYVSYFPHFGWIGTPVAIAGLGLCSTIVWKAAKSGRPMSVLLCAMLLEATAFSFNAEHFLLGLNGLIKAGLFFWFVYYASPALLIWLREALASGAHTRSLKKTVVAGAVTS